MWTQGDVKSQKIEYLSRLFLYRTETLYSCYTHHKVPWDVHCDISMATQCALSNELMKKFCFICTLSSFSSVNFPKIDCYISS